MPETRLLLDRRLVERVDGVRLAITPGVKHAANPLSLDGDREHPWTFSNLTASIYRDLAAQDYRGWYRCHVDGTREDSRFQPIVSADGIAWDRAGPDAGEAGPRTILYDERDPDPRRRYKNVQMAFFRPEPDGTLTPITISQGRTRNVAGQPVLRRMVSATSPDGREWCPSSQIVTARLDRSHRNWVPGEPDWEGGDCFPCVLWAPDLERYVAFFRTNIHNGEGQRRERAIGRADSADFERWGPHTLALQSKVLWHTALGDPAHDLYQMQVWRQGGVYLGIVSVFYWDEDRNHLELAWSPDTVNWERICPGTDLIPHGALGEYDGGCRYAAMAPIPVGDEVRVYYGGSNGRHNRDHSGDSVLCLALFRRDRFAGYTADGPAGGVILTHPFTLGGGALTLNAGAVGGAVHAELCDEAGAPLPGFERAAATPITTDALDAPLAWRAGGLPTPRERPVRLRLYLRNATVYALGNAA